MRYIHLTETDSTNSWLRDHAPLPPLATVVWADHQTAGRGCGTNCWESQPGKNLLFSVLCYPTFIPANRQFLLLEAMALAVKDAIDPMLPPGGTLCIKWPNDIYWHDSKLGGTLTETSLLGHHVRQSIIGTGLNINQTAFHSDAPNPVSLQQITGRSYPLEPLLHAIIGSFSRRLQSLEQGAADSLQTEYGASLYRRCGFYPYRDRNGCFDAEIVSVAPDGTLTLRDRSGGLRRYQFKEVAFILN